MPRPWVKKVSQEPRCDCGKPAVKRLYSPHGMWTCQRCIDLDKFVTEMHVERALKQKGINENSEVEDQSVEG